jgi:nuclear pore complex protein Nup62
MAEEFFGNSQGRASLRALDNGPADAERDRKCVTLYLIRWQIFKSVYSYMLATDLHTQLDDISGSLTQMIDAVNNLSLPSGSSDDGSEDPLTQISKILNTHLESLQWIDGAVKEVDGKVSEVERRIRSSSNSGGSGMNGSMARGRGYAGR